MGDIGQGYGHRKLSALAENTLHVDRAVMLQDNALGDGKTESCAADLSGP